MYIGTYSDQAIIDILKEQESSMIIDQTKTKPYGPHNAFISDERIKDEVINAGRISWAITHFFADSLADAFRKAKSMGLKNISQVSTRIYRQGEDY